jgi:glycosyltransferase involved in cell wall biosynthesis
MAPIADINIRLIYTDLLRVFVAQGHHVYIVSPRDRRMGIKTYVQNDGLVTYLGVRTLNLQQSSVIEKGIGQVLVEGQFKRAIKHYLPDEKLDLILYSTPPITFPNVISYLKRKNPGALTYLLLKDIFPQNAVDIGLMTKTGVKGMLYSFFRKKEKKLYALSDVIGCMSPANVEYVLEHNPEIDKSRVEVAPNSIELQDVEYEERQESAERYYIRKKYDLPTDKPVFIYGGNLGKPQGIDFLIDCLDANKNRLDCYFVIVGNGTEYEKIKDWTSLNKDTVVKLMSSLSKQDYDMLVKYCDVGMIFLDHRFTIPNYPSRLLSYLESKMPVICATDPNTDMGRIAEENGFGYWCESNSVESFTAILDKMIQSDRKAMGKKGYDFLCKNYLVENTYNAIMAHVK